ncbi:hypothetical protein CSV79_09585 [Sporosarcina sp. P13]|uniref:hypothetical protein n=1 Tax=Sporosarcina sp. P13 TaxID=2048263 RepID=UPI000C168383|nr:hypothetical protein [Sporosarcina sp. P13]PIC63918.1 hypothetical protein CSV79_09585 [Sporosarcina sp. P13]
MEKKLVKTAIYTVVGSFLVLFAVMPREKVITDFDGMSSYEIIPYSEFFFMLALYSVRIALVAVIIAVAVHYMLEHEKKAAEKP